MADETFLHVTEIPPLDDDPLAAYRSGSTEPTTANLIGALIAAKKPHVLIETGTFLGFTTRTMLNAMVSYGREHGSLLSTIEGDEQRVREVSPILVEFTKTFDVPVALQIVGQDALAFLKSQPSASVDFVFLDDDHTAAHVHEELVQVSRLLRSGGICCVHDVVGPFGLDAVVRSYGGIVLELERLHVAGGLGLLVRK